MPVTATVGQHLSAAKRIAVLSMVALAFAACFEDDAPPRRGPFAFRYSSPLSEDEVLWYSQFDLLITHDPLPPAQVARLHAAGTKLLFYEWAVAFYDSRATSWERSLVGAHSRALLNASALTGGVGADSAGAWYFDPQSKEHEIDRAADVVTRLNETGYDGVFLDTTRFESVHPQAREEYTRRHPDVPYDLAYSRFLVELRRKRPSIILFTNQGYRSAEHYLPYVDWDLAESLITRPDGKSFTVRPWSDHANPWSSILFVMKTMVEPLIARYPNVRLGHLNYIDGANPDAIRVALATAQLFGGEGFVASPNARDEVDVVYFRDSGAPSSPRVDLPDDAGSYRFFEHGMIAVSATASAITIPNAPQRKLRDRVTGETVCGGPITLHPPSAEPRAWFFDDISDCAR